MGTEKQGSKRGKNVSGFLQLFDWNAKSRKKLFSGKSDFPEKSKQKKRCDGNLPMTRLQMLDDDEYIGGSSIKGSSEYSCASSVTDEDFHGAKAPGVVARLMGLDSLPRSIGCEPNSTPLFDCRSLPGSCCQSENLEYRRDSQMMRANSLQDVPSRNDASQYMRASSLQDVPSRNDAEPTFQKVPHRPLAKFQTEILPPKSAKAIPVTRNRLLSPIKSGNVIPPENAAHIMEAAARIIEPGPLVSMKAKLPLTASSSVPFKVKDLKEKVQAAQKPSKAISEGSQRSGGASAVKQFRGHRVNKSVSSPGDATALRIFQDLGESPSGSKGNRKSISLALQAKENVQKREGLNLIANRSVAVNNLKGTDEISPNQPVKSQSMAQKNMLKKPPSSAHNNSSVVLRQNNQKQNNSVDGDKQPSKSKLSGGKVLSVESSSTRPRNSCKLVSSSKVSSRKSGSEVSNDKRQLGSSESERATSKKRSIDGNCHFEKNAAASIRKDKYGKVVRSRENMMNVPSSCWDQESEVAGTDVISFTFNAPMTRSGPGSGRYNEAGENYKRLSADSRNKRILLNSNGMSGAEFPALGMNAEATDTLSELLEQKLKELALTIEFSKQKHGGMLPGQNDVLMSSNLQESLSHSYSLEDQQGSGLYSSSDTMPDQKIKYLVEEESRKFLDCQLPGPGPVSVLEHSPFASSCSSSDTAESMINTRGGKQSSSMQIQDTLSDYSMSINNKLMIPSEREAELLDSASSISPGTRISAKSEEIAKPSSWEIVYVKEMLCNIEQMYRNYALGRACEIISPGLFDRLESRKRHLNGCGRIDQVSRRLMFDCVSECMEQRCRKYVGGGYKMWTDGAKVVKRKDKLVQDVHKDICAWSSMGNLMVDELVDGDMSSRYGRWLDFEVEEFEVGVQIESRILNSLIDELVADILVL
ncbi:uncharacterized protein LOC127249081 [Andrographis paniculata]|uniref:uncharacterized protein LOC127249081 n=1 Tax=Andrographis paniculata TaxID=175694 RepID=UPI0021E82B3F|nr:uncharacterized protein LOC127249081 [Andrographis paniculata]XP_051127653.1 uncharacterized protein LOC127249081 [Andrographis paniculata]XP_051127661.1 uncharacterized protein LOC127249081 [Andrographis paniculata]XP_051127670.1 uncharacterized protein LOC127249081 [Andrographis paniculata]XP_051127677.1 uncharacterized protein LOC127249081 [Andrographis paniculata]XP_051127687.1 uncharacterized protein LOC127249081 [Andrographis paniculata]